MKKVFSFFFSVLVTVGSAIAQPVPPPPPNIAIPLDTVVYALIFAGVLFGGYKLYSKGQRKSLKKA
jgi:hypothetical protein|tara:strand:- start:427 stop:624 length:198 start_codon:yes stop_codon:yes gene_type:complete